MPLYTRQLVTRAIPQCSGTHRLTRLGQHAIFSESSPIKACSFTRYNPWSLIVACQKYFIKFPFNPLRTACANDVAFMDPLIVACYMGMSESIKTAGLLGLGVYRVPLKLTRRLSRVKEHVLIGLDSLCVACCTKRVKRCVPLHCGMSLYLGHIV